MRQNLIIKDNKESEKLYKTFKKCFYNYILYEIELKNIENQIEQRKIGGKWVLTQNNNNNKNNSNNNEDKDEKVGKDKDKMNLKAK